jgi:Mce-associated membrane protein
MAAALAGDVAAAVEPDREGRRSVGPLGVITAICVVLALAAGVLLAVAAHSSSNRRAVSSARVAALAASKKYTGLLLTYSYQTLDQDMARAEVGMSAKFRANYVHTMTTQVRPLALKNHASSKATVVAAGVVSATPSRVRILLFADQVAQNVLLSATSRLDQTVNQVTMVKQSGRWVIDDVKTY